MLRWSTAERASYAPRLLTIDANAGDTSQVIVIRSSQCRRSVKSRPRSKQSTPAATASETDIALVMSGSPGVAIEWIGMNIQPAAITKSPARRGVR